MIRISNKYLLVALIGLGLCLILVLPFVALWSFWGYTFLAGLAIYATIAVPALAGLLILVSIWNTFDITEVHQEQ